MLWLLVTTITGRVDVTASLSEAWRLQAHWHWQSSRQQLETASNILLLNSYYFHYHASGQAAADVAPASGGQVGGTAAAACRWPGGRPRRLGVRVRVRACCQVVGGKLRQQTILRPAEWQPIMLRLVALLLSEL